MVGTLTIPSLRHNDPYWFPPLSNTVAIGEYHGLLATGGDLSPHRLKAAYLNGIFPWPDGEGQLQWWAPDPRAVIFSERIHISKSMRRTLNSSQFEVTWNKATRQLIEACSKPRSEQNGTWITEELLSSYMHLSNKQDLVSCEVWQAGQLVGGIFGIVAGKVFCGESMFHSVANASKLALIHVARNPAFRIIDCQFMSEHLRSMGAILEPLATVLNYVRS